jgi:hypothetical protein
MMYSFDGPRTLTSSQFAARLTFEPATKTSVARIVRRVEDQPPTSLLRFEPARPDPAVLAAYVGCYVSDEIPRALALAVVDGQLRIGTCGQVAGPEPLRPLTRDVFKTEDGGIRFERDPRGRVRGFVVSGEGYRGIRFERRGVTAG